MNRIGLVINLEKENVCKVATEIINWLEDNNCQVYLNHREGQAIGRTDLSYNDDQIAQKAECIIVLGGDGTLLNTAAIMAPSELPLFGINFGQLGFLTETEIADVIPALKKLLAGQYSVEERMMLQARVIRQGKEINSFISLNDAVITKGAFARIIYLETYINDEYVETYPADGLIVATPTGSTAYSLSAGGPLVTPDFDLIIMTPICPHTLYARPIVISPGKEIKVRIKSEQTEIMLTLDGQHGISLLPMDEVIIKKAPFKAKFIKLISRSFWQVLRDKMTEGRNVDA